MILKNSDYAKIKELVLDTYFMARDCDAGFMMDNLDKIMDIFEEQERRDAIRKSYRDSLK